MTSSAIEGLTRREYSAAKLGWSAILALQVAGLALALAGSSGSPAWSLVLGCVGLFAPIFAASVRQWAQAHQSRGDQCRRVMLVQQSWDRPIAQDALLTGLAEQTCIPSLDPTPLGEYYLSNREGGSRGFLDNLAESAFFTIRLSKTAAITCLWISAAVGASGVALLWMVANGWHGLHVGVELTKVPSALIAFSAGNEFLVAGLAFRHLSRTAAATLGKCQEIRDKPVHDVVDLILLLCTYDCALAQSPPIPGFLYRLQRHGLDQAWKAYGQSRQVNTKPEMPVQLSAEASK